MANISFKAFKQQALKDKLVKKEYEALAGEFLLARELIKARFKAKMTQEEVAEVMQTSKSNISRLESLNATSLPNLGTLMRYAAAVGCELQIKLTPMHR